MTSSRIVTGGLAWALALGVAGVACDKGEGSSPAAPASASAAPAASAAPSAAPSASAAAGATDAGAGTGNADAEAAQDEVVHNELQALHQHHHMGFAGFVLAAVETLGINPDQQAAIDSFKKEYHTKVKALREANANVLEHLADGVAAGNLDHAKIDGAIGKATAASNATQAAMHELITKLHGALRPEQRAALVDKVDAHWAAWREANEHTAEGPKPDRHLKRVAKELSLTKDQVEKAHANLEAEKAPKKPFDPKESEAYIKAFDTAFVEEKFDAKKLPSAGPESGRLVSWGAERMEGFYAAVLPVLTPEQRKTLADKLRARATAAEPKEKP